MHFAAPHWITAGLLIGLLYIAGWYRLQAKRQHALQSFVAPGLLKALTENVSRRKRRLKLTLQVLALLCCFIALARPQYGHHWVDVKQKGIDILFALDTSASMGVEDMLPNRLERAKFAILDFVGQLEGDRVGLLPFAGSAFLFCPLTTDYHAFEQSLLAVDTRIIPRQGTNLARAITTAGEKLRNDANHKLLILITDGESLQGDVTGAAAAAAREKMTIFTVGVGTGEGELIPVYRDGAREFVKDEEGRFVRSRLDETGLREIATLTGGLYVPLGNQGQGLATIHREKLARIPKAELNEKRKKVPIERFPWLLGLALVFLVADYLIGSRKNGKVSLRLPGRIHGGFFLLAVGVFSLFFLSTDLYASPGEEAFQRQDYEAAHQYYQGALKNDDDNPELLFNNGTAAYKIGRFEEAVAAFNRALHSDDLNLQEKAYYNLGNAYYRRGEQAAGENPPKAISHWQDALKAFEAALQLNKDNQRAEHNRNLVKAKLQQLRNRQQQQGEQKDRQHDQSPQKNQRQDAKNGEKDENERNHRPDTGTSKPLSPQKREDNQPGHNGKEDSSKGQTAPSPDSGDNPNSLPDQPEKNDAHKQTGSTGQRNKAMTKEEAHQLLDEMKNEDEIINFLPHGNGNPSTDGRNW